MSEDPSGAALPQGGSVLDGLMSMGGDLIDNVAKDMTGVGEVENVINAGRAAVDLGQAAYHGITGDTAAAGHDLGNAVADGFNAVPFHDVAWDGMMTLGRAIDGDGNHDPMWDQGGEDAFRDAVGGTPQAHSPSLPGLDPSTGPIASADFSQDGGDQGGDWSGDASGDGSGGGDWSGDASQDDSSMYDDQSMSDYA
ncbi:MAG TPA: hypothetical protein VFU65_15425 [Actinocrinis sp.]|nr:hypothetical protein [Actinocrinis sp.]